MKTITFTDMIPSSSSSQPSKSLSSFLHSHETDNSFDLVCERFILENALTYSNYNEIVDQYQAKYDLHQSGESITIPLKRR
ncbi:hypothetical protein GJ496_004750 [Pomphorhynchus laevis]|nr:hypothetical protein GJ496_004750 [Pomphorhynchus laevis]